MSSSHNGNHSATTRLRSRPHWAPCLVQGASWNRCSTALLGRWYRLCVVRVLRRVQVHYTRATRTQTFARASHTTTPQVHMRAHVQYACTHACMLSAHTRTNMRASAQAHANPHNNAHSKHECALVVAAVPRKPTQECTFEARMCILCCGSGTLTHTGMHIRSSNVHFWLRQCRANPHKNAHSNLECAFSVAAVALTFEA